MKKDKKFILYLLTIVGIVMISYLISSYVYEIRRKEAESKFIEEEIFKVGDREITFDLYRVNQLFFIKVPSILKKLENETLEKKYPTNDRPELVYESEDDLTHIFITIKNTTIKEGELSTFLENKKNELLNFEIEDIKTYSKYGTTFGKISYSNLDTYYDVRYFILHDKIITIEFNTKNTEKEDWMKVKKEILQSICFREEDTKKK